MSVSHADRAVAHGGVETPRRPGIAFHALWIMCLVCFAVIYGRESGEMLYNWNMTDSYYSHGFLIPIISFFFVWRSRGELAQLERRPSVLGLVLIAVSGIGLLISNFLGFGIFIQLSMVPMIAGLVLAFLGRDYLRTLWFPIFFLLFMIPLPPSATQAIVLNIKLLATEGAVQLAQLLTYPMIRDGSFVHFGNDKVLVGEVCGGLRSLIALLAFGTLMAYISKTRLSAKIIILLISGPIAIVSNIIRIMFLCVVGYHFGSEYAVGTLHDISGIGIFAVAFAMLFTAEALLRKYLPPVGKEDES
ncbi:MAG: exosortase/archaeosortase family protein [Candidatus Hydrogenedentes bacterium]|nr:exosortase/archaeosortase family protein [Candidatus Hydrogenedentota bacterium]